MKKFILTVSSLYFFWFLIFLSGRTAFIFYQFNYHFPPNTVQILFAGWQLDWSAASYFILIPVLLLGIQLFFRNPVTRKIFYGYHYLLIPVILVLTTANILLYKSWNTLLNVKALTYALQPAEMIASLTNKQLFIVLLTLLITCTAFIFLFKKSVKWRNGFNANAIILKFVFILFTLAFAVIGIRGGLQELPVNESAAAFSHYHVQNDIATNNIWYLSNSILKSGFESSNPYRELKEEEASRIFQQLFPPPNGLTKIIKDTIQPNIVLILLESWTADVIEPLGGLKNITPFFSSLADAGLLFANIYAAGTRTDQALPSVICGFPAQPNRSVMRYDDKIKKLPFITKILNQNNYATSFFYGGDLGFNNMHNFLVDAGFESIVGKEEFPRNNQNSKWGAHDEYVLMRQVSGLNSESQPFFSVLLTLTSHEPFEIPVTPKFPGDNDSASFINAVNYTDQSLEKYFIYARQQAWYKNTLFVLVADHGHILPLSKDYYNPRTHHIPLLFYGEALKTEYRGQLNLTIGNQNDLTASLLSLLNISSTDFKSSNNLFNHNRKQFAYINYDEQFGWKWDSGYYRYSSVKKQVVQEEFLKDTVKSEILNGIAYRQKLLDDFLSY